MNLKKLLCMLISIHLIFSYGIQGFLSFTATATAIAGTTYTSLTNDMTLTDGDFIDGSTISGEVNIKLNGGTVTIKNTINVTGSDAKLNIIGNGTLKRGGEFDGEMFDVHGDGELIIQGDNESSNIVIDGGIDWYTTDVENDSTRKKLNLKLKSERNISKAAISVGSYPDTVSGKEATIGKVTLKYVTMQNLYSTERSAAIQVYGDKVEKNTELDKKHSIVNMKYVKVQKCATTGNDAITMFNDCVANLDHCTYENNYSGNVYGGTIKAGGAEYFSSLTMKNCNAKGNYSSGWGGVVLWAANSDESENDYKSKATIDGCNFEGNTARWLGGAISNEAIMEVKNTTISNNRAMAGGGIANFPFTLDEKGGKGDDCGLTLSGNNQISGNKACASGNFTPFSKAGDDEDGDEKVIDVPISYPGGGGGIWCYMNMTNWKYTLELNESNKIIGNSTNYFGGGIYIDADANQNIVSPETEAGDSESQNTQTQPGEDTPKKSTLVISGVKISENQAVNGGGIATNDVQVELESGSIDANTASGNGGGLYLDENSTADLKGSCLIVKNKATRTQEKSLETVKQNDVDDGELKFSGVGGGIFLKNGSKFNFISGEDNPSKQIGIYNNKADVAANDVYACGESTKQSTKLNLPDVKNMNLLNYPGEVKPTGWYADYMLGDKNYPQDVIGEGNPGRYGSAPSKNVAIDTESTINKNSSAFYCLTLGYNHPGYGSLTIEKTGIKLSDHDGPEGLKQSSLFLVEGRNTEMGDISLHVTIVGNGSVTIDHLPDGKYTVTELKNWTWRYGLKSGYPKYYPEGEQGSPKETITISADKLNWKADFVNERKKQSWLSGDNYCKNTFNSNSDSA